MPSRLCNLDSDTSGRWQVFEGTPNGLVEVESEPPEDDPDCVVSPNAFNPLFLGHFSPVLRRLFTVLSRFPASWRQDGENGRKMA